MRSIYFDVSVPKVLATRALGRIWSGAYFARSSPVRMADLPSGPLAPQQIRVENRVSGICASDLHVVFADIDPRVHPAALPGYQRIYLGHEVVSQIVERGTEVRDLDVGDRVLMKSKLLRATCASQGLRPCRSCRDGNYGLCEAGAPPTPASLGVGGGWGDGYVCHASEVWRVPPSLSDDQAAMVEPLSCSVRAALRRLPMPGERALVVGCGTLGLGILMALRALAKGVDLYAFARHPHQRAFAERLGAHVLDGDLLEQAAAATGAKLHRAPFGNRTMTGGFDVIYDCVGNRTTVGAALRATRGGGAVVLAGVHLHPVRVDLTPVVFEEVSLIGSFAHGCEAWEGETLSSFDLTARLILEGRMDPRPLITHRFPLARWQDAIRTASDKRKGTIKVVFDFQATS
jgi:threonine dehydrogenase-like Zn-dependent dehydrogenase